MITEDDATLFWNKGAGLIHNTLPTNEVIMLRKEIEASLPTWQSHNLIIENPSGGRLKTDMLANPVLRKILTDSRIISVVRNLLGTNPVYFGDSTFSYGTNSRGWHRDNRNSDRTNFSAPDWQGKYPLIRVGLYLQDHARHSGGLGVRIGSHLPAVKNSLIHSKVVPRRLRSYLANHTGKPTHMSTQLGDLAIWTLRTLHSADGVRLKWFPHIRLAPLLENTLPRWATLPSDGIRMACFMTFAAPSIHLDRYMAYLLERDYMREMWNHSVWDSETLDNAASAGINVIHEQVKTLMAGIC